MSATTPATSASPTTELESPIARLVAEHGQLMTVTALRLMTVLALEKVRRGENRLTLKQLAEVTRLPVETVREVLHTLREQGSLLVTDHPPSTPSIPRTKKPSMWRATATGSRNHPRSIKSGRMGPWAFAETGDYQTNLSICKANCAEARGGKAG